MATSSALGRSLAGVEGDPRFQLDVGSVLSRTFAVWLQNLAPFILVGVVVHSPVLLGLGAIAWSGASLPIVQRLLDLLANLLTIILTAGVTYGVFQSLRGERPGVGEILKKGLARVGTVLLTGILVGLGTALGFCALVVPGLVLMTRWYVAIPVAVIENPGASHSLERSGDLTAGNRWRVFALMLVLGAVAFGATLALTQALISLEGSAQQEVLTAWGLALLHLLTLPLSALSAVAPAIVYHDLRVGREGADVQELLKVFE